MGKLTVVGKAEKSYTCDIMIITLNFQSVEKSTSGAVKNITSQSEHFLEILEKQGVNISDIHINNAGITCENDDKLEVEAEKVLELRLAFDMTTLNGLTEIIRKNSFLVDMDVSFMLSNMAELHDQLLKEAVIDSKQKAEMIAEITGQKVIGIDEMKVGDRFNRYKMICEQEQIHYMKLSESSSRSDKLKAPLLTENDEVEVTWIIE